MPDRTIYDEPSEVDAEDGTVTVTGPDAVDVRLTEAGLFFAYNLHAGGKKGRVAFVPTATLLRRF